MGCTASGSPAPSCPIGAGPGARRAAEGGGRRSASQGRGASATDTCLQGSAPARARRSQRVRLLPAGWAAALAEPARLLPRLLLLARGVPPAPRGPHPSTLGRARRGPPGRRWVPPGNARGLLGSVPASRPRCALARRLGPPPSVSSGFIPGSSCRFRAQTHSRSNTHIHSCHSRGPEEPARRGDPPRPVPALPLPPPAGRTVDLRGALLLPGSGRGCPATGWGEVV